MDQIFTNVIAFKFAGGGPDQPIASGQNIIVSAAPPGHPFIDFQEHIEGLKVRVTDEGSGAGTAAIAQLRMNWGDGTPDSIQPPGQPDMVHTYLAPGDYFIRYHVVDVNGAANNFLRKITLFEASTAGESPSGTRVPPAAAITDSGGAKWTRAPYPDPDGYYKVLRDGVYNYGRGSEVLYHAGKVYVLAAGNWWVFANNQWTLYGTGTPGGDNPTIPPPPAPIPPPPPVVTPPPVPPPVEPIVSDYTVSTQNDMNQIMARTDIQPGKIIVVRAGTYVGPNGQSSFARQWVCRWKGLASAKIIVRAAKGERAIIDGGINVANSDVRYHGLEFKNSLATNRRVVQSALCGAFDIQGARVDIVNCIIHDTGHPGIGQWGSQGDGGLLYGNIIWGCGFFDANDNGNKRGCGIYAQTKDVGSKNKVESCILGANFTQGIHFRGSDNTAVPVPQLSGFAVEKCVFLPGDDARLCGWWLGGQRKITGSRLIGNHFHVPWPAKRGHDMCLHEPSSTPSSMEAVGNYFSGGGTNLHPYYTGGDFRDNTFYNLDPTGKYIFEDGAASRVYSGNKYHGVAQSFPGGSRITGPPPDSVHIIPNTYDLDRAHIVVYNWSNKASVNLNLTGSLGVGDKFKILDAQNYFGPPVFTGTFDGSPVALAMPDTSAAINPFVGDSPVLYKSHTARNFGVFVLVAE